MITGTEREVTADALVIQAPARVVDEFSSADSRPYTVHRVGDCVAPRRLSNAVLEANRAIRSLD